MIPPADPTPRVAVLGLGAMGSRLAGNLLAAGHTVAVYNRTPAAAAPLIAAGARAGGTPARAAADADVVIACVTDDDASAAVWTDPASGALPVMTASAVAVECSTVSPAWAQKLAAEAGAAGVPFLEAPMIGTRPQADARQLRLLVSGSPEVLEQVRPVLATSASAIRYVGPPGTASTLKLVVNALLATQVVTVAELLGVTAVSGLDDDLVLDVLGELPVTSGAAIRAAGTIAAGQFAPNFPVGLVAKDLRYLLGAGADVSTPMTRAALAAYVNAAQHGHADEDLTAVARVLRPGRGGS